MHAQSADGLWYDEEKQRYNNEITVMLHRHVAIRRNSAAARNLLIAVLDIASKPCAAACEYPARVFSKDGRACRPVSTCSTLGWTPRPVELWPASP
jgi:hypothetical protein